MWRKIPRWLAAFTVFAVYSAGSWAWAQQNAGVYVDAEGVLRKQEYNDPGGQLTRQRIEAQLAALDPDIAKASPLRFISLNRLEKAIEGRIADGRHPTEEMQALAGLTRVRYVFFMPDSGDVVIAGPAEPWAKDLAGRTRGINSGRPIVELQDLIVALRAYPPGVRDRGVIVGCSIDPTAEGLARMQQFLRQMGGRATPRDTQFIVQGLQKSLGRQVVTIQGIEADTHMAQVLVEADYRMKLIGIGLEKPPIKLNSYVDRASATQVSRNAMQRWFFVPDYECLRVAEDRLAVELVGDGVKLQGEDEVVTGDGQRLVQSSTPNMASKGFVDDFTRNYGRLADKSPVYAQLRNCIDLLVAAAFIQDNDYYGHAGWDASTFRNEDQVPVRTLNVPKNVETAVNAMWKGNRLMTPVGGGVHIEPAMALASDRLLPDEDGAVAKQRQQLSLKDLPAEQWWWD